MLCSTVAVDHDWDDVAVEVAVPLGVAGTHDVAVSGLLLVVAKGVNPGQVDQFVVALVRDVRVESEVVHLSVPHQGTAAVAWEYMKEIT